MQALQSLSIWLQVHALAARGATALQPNLIPNVYVSSVAGQRRPATELTLFISPVSIQMTAPVSWRADSWNGRIGAASHGCSAATASLTSSVLLVLRTTMQQRFRQTCIHASMLLTSQPLQAGSIAGHQAESLNADHNLCMASNCQQAGQVPIACVPSAPAISSWSSLLLSMSSSPQPAQVTGHLALL